MLLDVAGGSTERRLIANSQTSARYLPLKRLRSRVLELLGKDAVLTGKTHRGGPIKFL